jgi:hypothetical protein
MSVWRANIDGSNPVKLTEVSSRYPMCSPDGKMGLLQQFFYGSNLAGPA